MTGTTTGQTSLAYPTDSDDVEGYSTVTLPAVLQALANLFESATGHDHSGAGKGKPVISAGIASGVTLTSPVLNGALTGTAGFNAFTAWSPTLTQVSGITQTTNYATYTQIGKLAIITCNLTATAAGTAGNAIVVGNLPVTLKNTGTYTALGSFVYLRSGVTIYAGTVGPSGSTATLLYTSANSQALGLAPSFAIANGDNVGLVLTVEVA